MIFGLLFFSIDKHAMRREGKRKFWRQASVDYGKSADLGNGPTCQEEERGGGMIKESDY